MNKKIEELIAETKLKDFLHKNDKTKKAVLWIFAAIGAIALIAGIAYVVYRIFAPDYLEDSDDIDDVYFSEEAQA